MRRSRRGLSGPPRRRWAPICVAGALLAILLWTVAPAAAAEPRFCVERYAHDYGERLAEMPRESPPPEGELPFGPRNFSMYRPEMTPVVLEGSNLGYRFAAKNGEGRTFHLDWALRAVLRSVDPEGRVKRTLARKQRRVGVVDDLDQLALTFPAPKHPGYYRIDVWIRDLESGKAVSYREHWRVLERSVDIDLAVSATHYRRGESVYGRVQNPGASRIFAPSYFDLQRYEGGWVEVPQPLTPAAVMKVDWWIEPGENVPCYRYDIPADAMPGLYRFVASAYAVELQRRVPVTQSFQIQP